MPHHRRIFFALVPILLILDQVTKELTKKFIQCTDGRPDNNLCGDDGWYRGVREHDNASFSEGMATISAGAKTKAFHIIDDFFALVHVKNPGAAFGILGDPEHESYRLAFFTVVTLVAFVMILWYYRQLRPQDTLLAISLSAVFAGAAGNFIDRLLFQNVTDFILVYAPEESGMGQWLLEKFRTNKWPAFNIADICINVGVGLFVWHVLFIEPKRMKAEEAAAEAAGKAGGGS